MSHSEVYEALVPSFLIAAAQLFMECVRKFLGVESRRQLKKFCWLAHARLLVCRRFYIVYV